MENNLPTKNNFNLIRLLAALQVCIEHTISHLEIDLNIPLIGYFPGVIVFFTTSGFLIYDSFTRNQDLKRYFKNRFLRIYPALWICFFMTVILLLIFKTIKPSELTSSTVLTWIFTQITVLQFYTPDLLCSWGVGTPNGSLWTIPVEIQFYIALPVIVLFLKNVKIFYKLLVLLVLSVGFNLYLGDSTDSESLYIKLLGVSLLPYLFYFIIGIIIREFWQFFRVIFINKFFYWIIVFLFTCYISNYSPTYTPSDIFGYFVNLLLAFVTISFAYSHPVFENLLHRQDISYGIYIFHMLVVNSLFEMGYTKDITYFFLSMLVTTIVAFLSWYFIERKALRFKM
jgi:peptidoglycan/LPS O-acetylase OafA/YrhL